MGEKPNSQMSSAETTGIHMLYRFIRADLAMLNMSRTSFYNKIKALTDQAPADYIRLIRLKHAAQLLKEQKHTITEISELTGFSDAKYFREVFKKHFNMSPSQYAKRGKEGKDDKEIK